MKMFIKNSYLFLIFFILLLSKNFLISLFIPKKEINIENIYIKKLEKELTDLKKIDNLDYYDNFIYGKVLYQNPYKFNEEVIISIKADNISKNAYVITNEGLLGIVDKVYHNFIIVKILTSQKTLLQVKINDCYGLLKYNKSLVVTNISNYCNVKINDNVYTSNLGYLDEEILVGKVTNIIEDENEITNNYLIEPAVNFNNLNYVVVISGVKWVLS